MSMSPAVLRAHAVGTEWQEGRMDVISAAGSRTSLSLTHAWSKNRALLPVTWALKKPDYQMFKSIPSPLESFQNMKWWCFTDGHISVALTTMRRGQWRSQRTREDGEVTAGDSSDRCMVTFHSGWHGQESSKRAREWVRERELKKKWGDPVSGCILPRFYRPPSRDTEDPLWVINASFWPVASLRLYYFVFSLDSPDLLTLHSTDNTINADGEKVATWVPNLNPAVFCL